MIIKMFELTKEGLIDFSPVLLAIKEFRDIYERDNSEGKRRAWLELSALYFIASMAPDNPYKSYHKEQKIEEINNEIFNKEVPLDLKDKLIQAGIRKMVEIDNTSIARKALRTAINATNKLDTYMEEIDLLATDDGGKPLYDAKKFQEIIRNNAGLSKSLVELEKAVAAENAGEGNVVRGGAKDELNI